MSVVASLPMYDVPELRAETDRFWACLRDALLERAIAAPDELDRTRDSETVWTDPALVLSQTCGQPYRLGLHAKAALVGAPDYGVEGCDPGYYCSALVVRSGDARADLADFDGARCAFNAPESQSGCIALLGAIAPFGKGGHFFTEWHQTGSHAASIEAVAADRADIAAIDAVSWRLAERYMPAAASLRALDMTEPTPGLPFITAKDRDPGPVADAVEAGIAALDSEARTALGIRGFVRFEPDAYLS